MALAIVCDVCGRAVKHHQAVQCHGCGSDLCPDCAGEYRAAVATAGGGTRPGIALPMCAACAAARRAVERGEG